VIKPDGNLMSHGHSFYYLRKWLKLPGSSLLSSMTVLISNKVNECIGSRHTSYDVSVYPKTSQWIVKLQFW